MIGRIALYYNTIKYLRPVQIAGQLIKPFVMNSKVSITKTPKNIQLHLAMIIPSLDLNTEYLSRFDVDGLMRNEITLLNESHIVDLSTWQVEASPLWSFNLHYFEYAIALAARFSQTTDRKYSDKFKELLESWIAANPTGIGEGWHPYTISMRIPNILICFDLFGKAFENDFEFREKVISNMYIQYRVLMKRKELWQLGNHYFENLKTILLGSLIFDEARVFTRHFRPFLREVKEEILDDGVHFELSPMYHKIVLEDIIRVTFWLRQADKPLYMDLLPVIQRMVNTLASIEKGMGKTPLFNDSGNGVAKDGEALLLAANELFDITPNYSMSFPVSGYYKLYDGDIALIFDAGEIGPKYMPGHAHCDCLSYELSIGGVPLFVNSGTFQYQGSKRNYFRSTRAHNTVMIGNHEQSECWGEHRVARRTTEIEGDLEGQTASGSYKNYLGEKHSRLITLKDNKLTVIDSTIGSGIIHSFLHLADGFKIIESDNALNIVNDGGQRVCQIRPYACSFTAHTTGELIQYAPEFGLLYKTCCLEFFWESDNKGHGYTIYF